MYTIMCKIAGEELLYNTGSPDWCSVRTYRSGIAEGEEGGLRGREYICNYDQILIVV